MPYHFTLHAHRLIDTDAQPIRESCSLIQVSFNPIKFIERCFWAVVWSRSEFEEALSKLPCRCCASIWSCTAVHRNAASETQVVLVGVQRHHRPAVCKVTQPVWQGAYAQQWLTVEHDISIKEAYKLPLCRRSFDIVRAQAFCLLFTQPFLRCRKIVNPR